MSKYVCNFEEVRNIANKIKAEKDNLGTNLNSYQSNIDNALSGWTGTAKEEFNRSNVEQIAKISANISQVEAIVDFINEAVYAIETTEAELASLNI